MEKFHFIDHTGDTGVVVYGKSLAELFRNAAESLFTIVTEIKTIQQTTAHHLILQAPGVEELLVTWLNEFLYLFDTRRLLFRRFKIEELDSCHVKAVAWGEEYNEERHPIKTLIKAVTFHQLRIEEQGGVWKSQIIFDL
jgi:SHS2 domain-containing protein